MPPSSTTPKPREMAQKPRISGTLGTARRSGKALALLRADQTVQEGQALPVSSPSAIAAPAPTAAPGHAGKAAGKDNGPLAALFGSLVAAERGSPAAPGQQDAAGAANASASEGSAGTDKATPADLKDAKKILADLVNALKALQKAKKGGGEIDPALLAQAAAAVAAANQFFAAHPLATLIGGNGANAGATGVDAISATGSGGKGGLSALFAALQGADPGTSGNATPDATPAALAGKLLSRIEGLSKSLSDTAPDLAANLRSLESELRPLKDILPAATAPARTATGAPAKGGQPPTPQTEAAQASAAAVAGAPKAGKADAGKTKADRPSATQGADAASKTQADKTRKTASGTAGPGGTGSSPGTPRPQPATATAAATQAPQAAANPGVSKHDTSGVEIAATSDTGHKASADKAAGDAQATKPASQADPSGTPPPSQLAAAAAGGTSAAAGTRAPGAVYQSAPTKLDAPQIAFEVARHVQAGQNHFQIRLDPPQMGRIDVSMHVDGSGAVHAKLTVDHPGTLDMLQRDARGLERALMNAGMDGSKANLEFSLRQNPFGQQPGQQQGQPQGQPAATVAEVAQIGPTDTTTGAPAGAITSYSGTARLGGLNIWA